GDRHPPIDDHRPPSAGLARRAPRPAHDAPRGRVRRGPV
ncbi:MAG: hypothetical protein AVDCRST_MAG12-1064, partial [uncultured Rubrobacteraceae bacterium]